MTVLFINKYHGSIAVPKRPFGLEVDHVRESIKVGRDKNFPKSVF